MKTNFSNAFLYAVSHDTVVDTLFNTGAIKVLLACESGSRAWGFDSPDSDHDIRFVYARPKDWYIGLGNPRDVIEFTVRRPNLVLDVVGWDIRKYLSLMGKGNAQTYEWLKCPPYFRQPSWLMDMVDLAKEYPNWRAVGEHYRGLARRHFARYVTGQDSVSCKKYLYLFRALYSLKWIVDYPGEFPPLRYDHLVNAIAPALICNYSEELLKIKMAVGESAFVHPRKEIDDFIVDAIDYYTDLLRRHVKVDDTSILKWAALNKFLLQTLDNY